MLIISSSSSSMFIIIISSSSSRSSSSSSSSIQVRLRGLRAKPELNGLGAILPYPIL